MSKMTPVPSHLLSEAEQRGENGWANFHYNSALVLGGIRLWGSRFGEMNMEMVSQWISEWTVIHTPPTLRLCFRLTITCCWMCVVLRIKPQHVHRYLEPVAAAGMFWPQHTNCPFICIYLQVYCPSLCGACKLPCCPVANLACNMNEYAS